jgi:transposase
MAKGAQAKPPARKPGPAKSKIDAIGIDAVVAKMADGKSMTAIAEEAGVSIGTLIAWLEQDPERSARAREARILSARIWDERAEARIEEAADAFELARAKELAHHYRWRAAKIAPRDYGEKVTAELSGSIQVERIVREVVDPKA